MKIFGIDYLSCALDRNSYPFLDAIQYSKYQTSVLDVFRNGRHNFDLTQSTDQADEATSESNDDNEEDEDDEDEVDNEDDSIEGDESKGIADRNDKGTAEDYNIGLDPQFPVPISLYDENSAVSQE